MPGEALEASESQQTYTIKDHKIVGRENLKLVADLYVRSLDASGHSPYGYQASCRAASEIIRIFLVFLLVAFPDMSLNICMYSGKLSNISVRPHCPLIIQQK